MAVRRGLRNKNPYDLMMALKAEEPTVRNAAVAGCVRREMPYAPDASKVAISKKLKAKHRVGGTD
jgi:hypothetical protein